MTPKKLNEIEKPLLHLVERDVVPALGCTEPISLALAAATAAKYLGKTPERIEAKVSPNLMKNGLGVAVPGTGMVGLPIAAAIGALGGNPEGELEVLKHITPEQVSQAKAMLDNKLVNVGIHQTEHILYSEAVLFSDNDRVKVAIQDQHTNIILIEKNGEVIFEKEHDQCADCDPYDIFKQVSAREIFEFSCEVELDKIRFIGQAAALNRALSDEGLRENYGLHIGRTLRKQVGSGLMSDDLLSKIMIETTAASDARMGGATLPAMSNSGSGNQGIAATMPVVVVADYLNVSEEKRLRALFLSHLMAIYIHSKLPKLSALCAVTTASMGSCAGIAYLLTVALRLPQPTLRLPQSAQTSLSLSSHCLTDMTRRLDSVEQGFLADKSSAFPLRACSSRTLHCSSWTRLLLLWTTSPNVQFRNPFLSWQRIGLRWSLLIDFRQLWALMRLLPSTTVVQLSAEPTMSC